MIPGEPGARYPSAFVAQLSCGVGRTGAPGRASKSGARSPHSKFVGRAPAGQGAGAIPSLQLYDGGHGVVIRGVVVVLGGADDFALGGDPVVGVEDEVDAGALGAAF